MLASASHSLTVAPSFALSLSPDLPLTQEFLKLHNTVPAGTYEGKPVKESMPMVYFADETFKTGNKLQPSSAEGKEAMKALITKFTSGQYDVTGPFYQLLFSELDDKTLPSKTASLLASYAELSKDLSASGGPYLVGQQFTAADIAVIPFVDRALLLLGHYRSFVVPDTEEYKSFHAWRKAYKSRLSYQITNADRLPRSVAVQPFAATKRDAYIIEM